MPAGLPDETLTNNLANPSAGRMVLFDSLSGPKGSPLDRDPSGKASTGALSTGIGFGSPPVIGVGQIRPQFTDDYTVGLTKPDGTSSPNSTILYIGGGRSAASGAPNPYTAGFALGGAGNGGSRDAGAGPAFTDFTKKLVTATGTVANGAVVETGFVNRSGVTITTGLSVFGSASAAQVAPV